MKPHHENKVNPCARLIGQIAQECFLIGAETEFEAHFSWSAHVNELNVEVRPKSANSHIHNVMEIAEYINIPTTSGCWGGSDFRTDTYPKVKNFLSELRSFRERALDAA